MAVPGARGLVMIADLARLTWTFLWLSLICIGGGLGVVPELERQVVRHAWVTPQEFIDGYALSQLTPGPSMLVAVFVGYRAHGLVGALLAGTAMFLPVSLLAAVITRNWAEIRQRPWAQVAERAMTPIGIGLTAAGVYTLARAGIHGAPSVVIAILAGLALWTGRVPAIVLVLAGAAAGWLAAL
jgi:chromate transporter